MKAIVSVLGKDRVGITAAVCTKLAENNINILDISQTIMDGNFSMVMIVDMEAATRSIKEMGDVLQDLGSEIGQIIRIQREDIFGAMHRI
ncbi:MAG: ACT domain-containing protein [Firmicutes bacterium]|nr:ACT domain-containing protein [Bacillota bacterium]